MSSSSTTGSIGTRLPNWALYLEKYFEGSVALLLLTVILVTTLIDITGRALIGWTIDWGFEVAQGLFVWIAWLGASMGVRHESYFRFTLLRGKLSRRGDYLMYVVEWTLWLVVIGAIYWYSIPELYQVLSSGRVIVGTENVLQAYFYLAVPVGTGLILLRVFQRAVVKTLAYRRGEEIRPDPKIGVRD
ncbi:TRAP transporter small permease [Halalkalicoccus tibetensis]|uniref:TRAP transporter small permease n=1 Tax=Halalkalicoccus tibetensis TaxID=175632 RepID=A0ABD5V105_9EURY